MINQQELRGNWNEIKGKLRARWGQMTNDELQAFDGNVEQLVGLIQRKTGETRNSIEHVLEELTSNGSSAMAHAKETVREFAHQAAETIQDKSKQAAESVHKGIEGAEQVVRDRPTESILVCFGAGVLVGVFMGFVLRSSR